MIDRIDILIATFMGAATIVALLCGVAAYRGGFIAFGQETKKPTKIQMMFSVGMLSCSLIYAIDYINSFLLDSPNHTIDCLVYGLVPLCLGFVLLQTWVLQQKELRLKHWMIAFVPYVPFIIISATLADIYPTVFYIVGYITNAYLVCTLAYSYYTLRLWDKKMVDTYSEIAHKQTVWFQKLLIAFMIMELLWIPYNFFPDQQWILAVNYLLEIIIFISSTAHALTQEEFCLEDNLSSTLPNRDGVENEDENGNEEALPSWVSLLDKAMSEDALYKNPELNLADLAKVIGTNRSYLSKYLNDTLSTTFYDYVNNIRLLEVEKLLATTDLPLDEITIECGFKSRTSLYNNFRKKHSLAPSTWREKNLLSNR